MPSSPSGPRDALEERLSEAEARVGALEGFSFDAGRLRRMLDEALRRRGSAEASSLADGLETRLGLVEEDLREAAGAFLKPSRREGPSSGVLEEALGLVERALSSRAFQDLVGAARQSAVEEARKVSEKAEADLAVARRELRDETSKSQLDIETAHRQLASLEAALASLQDRPQAPATDLSPLDRRLSELESRLKALASVPPPAPVDLAPVSRRLDALEKRPPADVEALSRKLALLEPALQDLSARAQADADQIREALRASTADLESRLKALASVSQRLDALEAGPKPPDLTPLLLRVGALESAPKAKPTPAADLAPLERRLDSLEKRPLPAPPPAADLTPLDKRLTALESAPKPVQAPAIDLSPLERQLAELESRLKALASVPPPAPVDLAPVSHRLEALEKRPLPAPPPATDFSPLEKRLASLESAPKPPDLTPLQLRVGALESAPKASPAPAVDLSPLSRRLDALEKRPLPSPAAAPADVEALSRRLTLLEPAFQDLSARTQADADRIREALRTHQPADLSSLDRRLSAQESKLQALAPTPAQMDGVSQRLARLESALDALREPLSKALQAPDAAAIAAGLKGEIDGLAQQAAARALTPLLKEMADKLASLPSPESLQAAILKAGEAMDERLTDRLGGLLSQAPAAPAADGAALQAMVQQAMSEAFPLEELGKILEQKVAKRSEALRNELREVEAELVKAVMKQMDAKPMGEAQVTTLIDKRVNQLLLKYVQR